MLRTSSRGTGAPLVSLGLALVAISVLPGAANAAVVRMTPESELRIDGFEAQEERITVRYEAVGGGGAGGEPRLVISDPSGVFAIGGSSCRLTGPETITCDALPVRSLSVGLALGNDTLTIDPSVPAGYPADAGGGPGNDVIQTAGADDVLRGDDGRDVLGGGEGDDRLVGGSGSDGLIGFAGNDLLNGGTGSDALFGQAGRDSFRGGAGNDLLLGRDHRRDRLLDCGPGSQERAVRDRIDPRPRNCPAGKPKKKR